MLPRPWGLRDMCQWPRLSGELLLRLWQKGRQNHERDEPFAREAQKPRRTSEMVDDQARKCRTESGADTHHRAEHSLGEIEPSSAFGHIGEDHCGYHPHHGPSDNVQQLDRYQGKWVADQGKQHCAYW